MKSPLCLLEGFYHRLHHHTAILVLDQTHQKRQGLRQMEAQRITGEWEAREMEARETGARGMGRNSGDLAFRDCLFIYVPPFSGKIWEKIHVQEYVDVFEQHWRQRRRRQQR